MKYEYIGLNKSCCGNKKSCCNSCSNRQLSTFDWLSDISDHSSENDLVEVQFKNTRKSYFRNTEKLELYQGSLVTVEANPGHDIGVVTLTGKLVELAIKKHRYTPPMGIVPRIYRIATENDIDKWNEAKAREDETMILSRQIAKNLNLDMKIGDVEYQADGMKAIFYYIADNRVDFRQLIKVLAETFSIRVEMKQIGARQEAGRIGGIGPCGRELCCSSWKTNFVSVNTSAARLQDLSLNPQKLTGMCGKLKCCLNYEVDTYLEAHKTLPSREIQLETKENTYYHFKTDYFKRLISYSLSPDNPNSVVQIDAKRAFEIIKMNKNGIKPDTLEYDTEGEKPKSKSIDILDKNSITRFDNKRKSKFNNRSNNNNKRDQEFRDTKDRNINNQNNTNTENKRTFRPNNKFRNNRNNNDSRNIVNSQDRQNNNDNPSPIIREKRFRNNNTSKDILPKE